MIHDENLMKAEYIDDFYIRAMDKRYKYSSVESLEEFDRICKKHNLTYYAYYGTLLGTIRHKGFIPWDDDIDVAMMREDYNRFIHIAKEELQEPFVLNNVEDSCFHPLRVQNGFEIQYNQQFLERFHYCPYPTGIDIYVLDKLPADEETRALQFNIFNIIKVLSQYLDPLFETYGGVKTEEFDDSIPDTLNSIEELLHVKIERDGNESKHLGHLASRVAAMYNDTDSDVVTRMAIWATDGQREMMPIQCFEQVTYMPFEHMLLPVPTGYDEILTRVYGDYMTPVKGGGAHEYRHYLEYEEKLFQRFDELGIEIPDFLKE